MYIFFLKTKYWYSEVAYLCVLDNFFKRHGGNQILSHMSTVWLQPLRIYKWYALFTENHAPPIWGNFERETECTEPLSDWMLTLKLIGSVTTSKTNAKPNFGKQDPPIIHSTIYNLKGKARDYRRPTAMLYDNRDRSRSIIQDLMECNTAYCIGKISIRMHWGTLILQYYNNYYT